MTSYLKLLLFLLVFIAGSCWTEKNKGDSLDQIIANYEAVQKADTDRHSVQWPDYSESHVTKRIEELSDWANQLKELDIEKLSAHQRINFDLLDHIVNNELFLLRYGSHYFPLNSEGGFLTGILYDVQQKRLDSEKQRQDYKVKLQNLSPYLAERKLSMKQGMREGKMSPKLIVKRCLDLLSESFITDTSSSVFIKPLETVTNEGFKDSIVQIISTEVLPAFEDFQLFLLEEYLPAAPEAIGISHLEGGKEYYEQRVRFFTTLDVTPEEVFNTGQSEVRRIRDAMGEILEELNWKGDFASFLEFLRSDPRFYASTPEQLLHYASWLSKKIEGRLPELFGTLPRMPFTVEPVPAAIAPNYTGGRYSGGSYKDHRAGAYWVNTYKLESRPLYVLPALTLHEAVPGHHLQIMIAQEVEDVPDFRNRTYLSAYGEGWGLYSEWLGIEAGMYETPFDNFGRLTYEMWRACRLVVDVGMHYMNWSREQAIEFMAGNTALSLHEVNTEIDRYIGWPAQAVSYKIGEMKIRELRKLAEDELGEKFDVRVFHDKVLENGSIPLFTLERIIQSYISDQKSKDAS